MFYLKTDLLRQKIEEKGFKLNELNKRVNFKDNKVTLICNSFIYPRIDEAYLLALELELTDSEIVEVFFSELGHDDDGIKTNKKKETGAH